MSVCGGSLLSSSALLGGVVASNLCVGLLCAPFSSCSYEIECDVDVSLV